MDVKQEYPLEVLKWEHLSVDKFMGNNEQHFNYRIGVTPQDPEDLECFYFNVEMENKYVNQTGAIPFETQTRKLFKIRNNGQPPTIDLLLNLMNVATSQYAQLFYQKREGTNLAAHKIPKPLLANYEDLLAQCILDFHSMRQNNLA